MKKTTGYKLEPIQLDVYRPLRDVVSDVLRQAIKDGVLKPGERLMEIRLAEELGVSRTPIREAIRKLEQEGFVVMVPRRGTYVADISLKDISQVFEIRGALEELAAGLAAERITPDELERLERILVEINEYMAHDDFDKIVDADVRFHDVLYQASRNQRLVDILHNLREQMLRFRSISMHYPGRLAATWEEHRQMVENIANHNSAMARKVAKKHMENSEKTLLKGISQDEESARQIHELFPPFVTAAAGKEGDRMLHSFVHFVSLVRNKEKNMDEYEHFLCVLTIVLFVLLLVRSLVALYMGRWNLFTDI